MTEKKKILAVDDMEDNLMIMEHVLKSAGYEPILAKSGEEAIEIAKREKPALIILDIKLPGIDGTKTGEIIRANPETAGIPIIYLTGLLSKKEEKELDHHLAGSFVLAKPYNINELLEQIELRLK